MYRPLKIALTMRIVSASEYAEHRDALAHDWFDLFNFLDAIPICIPNTLDNIDHLVEIADMVILTGGDDINLNYENKNTPDSENYLTHRDVQEYRIIDTCIKKKIPILGVCRGMQIINYRFGGFSRTLDSKTHVNNEHEIFILNESTIGERLSVNSYHNQGIFSDTLGEEMNILAVSQDNSIEAFEHKKYSIMGIMWHPERKKPFSRADKELIVNFINKSVGELK